jgi:hypothetical protein
MKKVVTIAVEFLSPLIDNDFNSFDLDDDNVIVSLVLYNDWRYALGHLKSVELLDGDNDARLDECEITGRLCDCFDVEITMKENNENTVNIDVLRDELVEDCLDTCLNDTGYLKSIIQDNFRTYSDDDIIKLHHDAFGDRD